MNDPNDRARGPLIIEIFAGFSIGICWSVLFDAIVNIVQ
jgi:hypothetical protein